MRGILGRGRGMRAVWRGNDTARRFLHLCAFASWRLIQPPANKFEATKNTKSTSVDSPIPGIPGIPGIPDSKTGCNHTYRWKTNRIGSGFSHDGEMIFISDEFLGSFGKKREFPFFIWREAASLLKNTHLTKGAQALNRQIEGLPGMPETRYPKPDTRAGSFVISDESLGSFGKKREFPFFIWREAA